MYNVSIVNTNTQAPGEDGKNGPGEQYMFKLTCVKVASYIFAASLLVVDSGNPSLLQALKLIE